MSVSYEFTAKVRTEHGKSFSRRMRRDYDMIPAVIYGAGKPPQSIAIPHKALLHGFSQEAVFSHVLDLVVEGRSEKVIIKDLQRHPYKPKILHVDFLRVQAKEKIHMSVPLHFVGDKIAPGVKSGGGSLTKSMTELNVFCLPADLPECIEVDVSEMTLGKTLHVSDILLPRGVELAQHLLDESSHLAVVSCHTAKTHQDTADASAQAPADQSTEDETSTA